MGLELKALDVAIREARLKTLVVTKNLVRKQYVKVQNIDLMLKKLHTQKYTFSKIKVFIVLVFYMLGTLYMFLIFPKLYILFRTCISFPIHCYISLKIIQNIFKIVWYSKLLRKTCFGPGRSTERSTVAYYRP